MIIGGKVFLHQSVTKLRPKLGVKLELDSSIQLLMLQKSGDHQLRLVVEIPFSIIYKLFFYIPGGFSPDFFHQQQDFALGVKF